MTTSERRGVDVAFLVPAAGAGTRLGSGVPKALQPLAGEPLVAHAARRLRQAAPRACLIVAAPAGLTDVFRALIGSQGIVVTGREQRQQSVAVALSAVPAGCDVVLVHDAARALAPVSLVEDVLAAIRSGHEAVVPVLPVTDTITQVDPSGAVTATLDRAALRAVQTPQGFRRQVLEAAHAAATTDQATDDAALVARLGVRVHTIPGSPQALKITTPQDLLLAEALVAAADRTLPV